MIDNKYNVGDHVFFLKKPKESGNSHTFCIATIAKIIIIYGNVIEYSLYENGEYSKQFRVEEKQILGINVLECPYEKKEEKEIKEIIKINEGNEFEKIEKIKQEYFNFMKISLNKWLIDNNFIDNKEKLKEIEELEINSLKELGNLIKEMFPNCKIKEECIFIYFRSSNFKISRLVDMIYIIEILILDGIPIKTRINLRNKKVNGIYEFFYLLYNEDKKQKGVK